MSQEQDFKKLQQKTYQSYHQDGLIDILIGLGFIGFGLNMAFDNSVFIFLAWMPIIFYVPFKNRITVPRIGYVKFTSSNTRLAIAVAVLLLVFLIAIFLFLITGRDNVSPQLSAWISQYYLLPLAVIAGICFVGAALLTGITRLYAYAGLIIILFAGGIWFVVQPPFFVLITGVVIEAVGIWMLVRFLRKYPLGSEEGLNESE